MGFIDWHGKGEDHFDEVVSYAKAQQREEERSSLRKDLEKWIPEFTGNRTLEYYDSRVTLKALIDEQYKARSTFGFIIQGDQLLSEVNWDHLYEDWMLHLVCHTLELTGLSGERLVKTGDTLMLKVFHGSGETTFADHLKYKVNKPAYMEYFRNCFEQSVYHTGAMWEYFGRQEKKRKLVEELIDQYSHILAILGYYLFQNGSLHREWIEYAKREKSSLKSRVFEVNVARSGSYYRKILSNPLYSINSDRRIYQFIKVIIFQIDDSQKGGDDSPMMEDLYAAINAGEVKVDSLTGAMPEQLIKEIGIGRLPVIPGTKEITLLQGEKLHYFEPSILYYRADETADFVPYKGYLYLTDTRLLFSGVIGLVIRISDLDRVVMYSNNPCMIEIKKGSSGYAFRTPDIDVTYKVLELLANSNTGEDVPLVVNGPSYQQLTEKPDLDACIFAYECLESNDSFVAITPVIADLVTNLRCLSFVIKKYPEREQEITRFLEYYLPEGVHVLQDYQEYVLAGLAKERLDSILKRISESVETLNGAVEQKIADIFMVATMQTISYADALKEVLEQAGFSKDISGNLIH